MIKTADLFDLSHTTAREYLKNFEYPWQIISEIKVIISELIKTLPPEYIEVSPNVRAHKSADISPFASICAPCIIGKNTQVRYCAFIRGNAIVGDNCVVGNSVELKNVILFDNVQIPHFNYAGDSLFGFSSHMGAGAITSNVKSDKSLVTVVCGEERCETGLKKCGAFVGDFAEIGCNSVLNPAAVIGRNSTVYPLSSVRGSVPPNSIYKSADNIVPKKNSRS